MQKKSTMKLFRSKISFPLPPAEFLQKFIDFGGHSATGLPKQNTFLGMPRAGWGAALCTNFTVLLPASHMICLRHVPPHNGSPLPTAEMVLQLKMLIVYFRDPDKIYEAVYDISWHGSNRFLWLEYVFKVQGHAEEAAPTRRCWAVG